MIPAAPKNVTSEQPIAALARVPPPMTKEQEYAMRFESAEQDFKVLSQDLKKEMKQYNPYQYSTRSDDRQ